MDWNGDGHLDALVGGYGGDVTLFLGKDGGGFAAGSPLTFHDGEPFERRLNSDQAHGAKADAGAQIWCVDWDEDGDYDILSGWFFGGMFLTRNNGSKAEAKLSKTFETIQADGKDLKWGFQTQPCMADWDGDGRKDLIYSPRVIAKSGQSSVAWCRNLSESGEPRFGPSQVLVYSGPSSQMIIPELGFEREFGGSLAVVATDWDGDGAVDLVVGDVAALSQPKPDLGAEDRERAKDLAARMRLQTGASMANLSIKEVRRQSLAGERRELVDFISNRAASRGRVWLLRRIPQGDVARETPKQVEHGKDGR